MEVFMKLELADIQEYIKSKEAYQKGLQIYKNGLVKGVNTQFNKHTNCTSIVGEVSETKRVKYTAIATFDEAKGQFVRFHCDCVLFKTQEAGCEHMAAVLLAAYYQEHPEELVEEKEEVVEVSDAENLISFYTTDYEKKLILQAQEISVTLIPQLEQVDGELYLSFKIESDKKKYAIKNIEEFIKHIREEEYASYGKELAFTHHLDVFSNPALVIFLMREYENREYIQTIIGKSIDAKYLYLNPSAFDEFFWRFVKDKITHRYQTKETPLHVCNVLPHISLMVEEKEESFLLRMRNPMYYVNGNVYGYYISGLNLYYCSAVFHQACSRLLSYFNTHEVLEVAKNKMRDFYNSVLVEVRGFIQFLGNVEEYVPNTVTNRLYIDFNKNVVHGFLMHYYGENEKYMAFQDDALGEGRDVREETKARLALKKYTTEIDESNGSFVIRKSLDQIYDFLSTGIAEMSNTCEIYASERVRKINIVKRVNFGVGLKIESNLLKLDFTSDIVNPAELMDVLKAYKEKRKYFRLKDGSIIQLMDDSIEAISSVVDSLHLGEDQMSEGSVSVPTYRALTLDATLKSYRNIELDRDSYYRQLVKSMKNVGDSEFPIPDTMKKILRNYQKEGYRWLKTMASFGFGGILADDMGIGKTIQIIALFEEASKDTTKKSLVVCPASLILNWDSEIKKFTSDIKTHIIMGSQEERARLISMETDAQVWITSYDYLKRDYEQYSNMVFEYLIVDEAQFIKNQYTKNAVSVKQIQSKYKFALTGTPIENSLSELWSIFDFLMPGYLFDYSFFKKYYENPIVKYEDEEVLEDLRRMVEPFILRRVKKDVLKELPDKIESTILVDFDEESKKLYDANLSLIRQDLETQFANGQSNNKILVIAMLTKLRQLCCAPQLLYDNFAGEAVKLDACMEIVNNCKENKKKVLIFSQFTSLLDIIAQRLFQENISYYMLTGDTSKSKRQEMVNTFNQDDTQVFLISLKAGGTGLNLTGAEVVIHFDPWWNLSAQNQATDRAHRFGQEKNVQVFKLIVRNSIEEKILNLQEKKKDLSDAIINENEGIITKMSKEDILELFQ